MIRPYLRTSWSKRGYYVLAFTDLRQLIIFSSTPDAPVALPSVTPDVPIILPSSTRAAPVLPSCGQVQVNFEEEVRRASRLSVRALFIKGGVLGMAWQEIWQGWYLAKEQNDPKYSWSTCEMSRKFLEMLTILEYHERVSWTNFLCNYFFHDTPPLIAGCL